MLQQNYAYEKRDENARGIVSKRTIESDLFSLYPSQKYLESII